MQDANGSYNQVGVFFSSREGRYEFDFILVTARDVIGGCRTPEYPFLLNWCWV